MKKFVDGKELFIFDGFVGADPGKIDYLLELSVIMLGKVYSRTNFS